MILVIDIGNTNIAVSGIRNDKVEFTGSVPSRRDRTQEDFKQALAPLLSGRACRGAILSSVVPEITKPVAEAVEGLLSVEVLIVDGSTRTGLTIPLPEPERIGRDRLVDAAWAAARFPLPAVTADLGTATTLNVILPGGIFAGGMICAGLATGLQALADRTSQLPRLAPALPEALIGRDTRECMLSGACAGTAAMIDGLVTDVEEQLGCPVTLLLTGGGSPYILPYLRHSRVYDPEMTRKGLALLYELNRG